MNDEPPDNYADLPKTVGELRAGRSQEARDWKPRDALIACLRDIDSGKLSPTQLLIVGFERNDVEDRYTTFLAGAKRHEALALCEAGKLQLWHYGD